MCTYAQSPHQVSDAGLDDIAAVFASRDQVERSAGLFRLDGGGVATRLQRAFSRVLQFSGQPSDRWLSPDVGRLLIVGMSVAYKLKYCAQKNKFDAQKSEEWEQLVAEADR